MDKCESTLQMIIEKATNKDLDELRILYYQLTEETSDLQQMKLVFEKMANNEMYHVLVARNEQNEVVGTVMGILCYDLVGSCVPFMLIENVVVSDNYRGKGIGKRLMLALESIANSNGCSYLMLVSGMQRNEAHAFYEDLGYFIAKGFKKKLGS